MWRISDTDSRSGQNKHRSLWQWVSSAGRSNDAQWSRNVEHFLFIGSPNDVGISGITIAHVHFGTVRGRGSEELKPSWAAGRRNRTEWNDRSNTSIGSVYHGELRNRSTATRRDTRHIDPAAVGQGCHSDRARRDRYNKQGDGRIRGDIDCCYIIGGRISDVARGRSAAPGGRRLVR